MQDKKESVLSDESESALDTMIEYAMLFDFYGALLKDRNVEIFEDYMFNDMSLSEIADEQHMSRQGVRDTVIRSRKKLVTYEEKLGLVERFNTVKRQINSIIDKTDEVRRSVMIKDGIAAFRAEDINGYFDMIEKMAGTILEDL
ncbi:MAG: DNA-binding protein [Lachnospiraceae bacterium]|nr:DNA-binding protein [Lachnospiraceae bacterium]